MPHSVLLALHITAGLAGLVLGPLAAQRRHRRRDRDDPERYAGGVGPGGCPRRRPGPASRHEGPSPWVVGAATVATAAGRADVRPLMARDVRAAGALLTASHCDYPAFRHVFPDSRQRDRVLRHFLTATAADAASCGASTGGWDAGELVGVALWLPPGAFPWSTRRRLRAMPALTRAALAAPRSFGDFARIGAAAERAHSTEPHWYLEALGGAPRRQGQGWGTRLVRPGLVLADAGGMPCYVETSDPRNARFYERLGFVVTEPVLGYLPGGPDYLRMRRPAPAAPAAPG